LLGRLPPPRLVVFAGFAGALDAHLAIGDVVIADQVWDGTGRCWRTWAPDVKLPPRMFRGPLLTTNRLIASAGEKHVLAQRSGCQAVDMESAPCAARCAERGIPFSCVRAISDRATTDLSPELVSLLSGPRVSSIRLAGALLRRPWIAAELWRLGRDTRVASKQLALALHAIFTTLRVLGSQSGQPG
jgi:adenosylhomocysteine nucleosidase